MGFMKGRHITSNLKRTLEVIKYCNKNRIEGVIMSIDFEKCFDKIEHKAIYGALEYFKFPPEFIKWSKLFFTDFLVFTQNFGIRSEAIVKGRGSNQGCCISPFYYLCCGELLSRKLRQNDNIVGIRVGGVMNLITQFADDTALFLKFDTFVLENVIQVLSHIETQTGLTINYDKMLIYRIGSLANSNAMLYTSKTFNWTNEPFTLLGLEILNDGGVNLNFESVVARMQLVLDTWKWCPLTLMGKITILNTLCESLFVYKLSVLPNMPYGIKSQVVTLIKEFLWDGKKAKIHLDTLCVSKESGGLRLWDVNKKEKALKIGWISRIMSTDLFKFCFFDNVRIPEWEHTFRCNLNRKDAASYCIDNEFWGQVFIAWCEYCFMDPQNLDEILGQIIWLNSHIKLNNKPLFWRKCVSAGLMYIADIYDGVTANGF